MEIIDLSNPNTLPNKFISRLNEFDDLFKNEQDLGMDDIEDNHKLSVLVSDINEYCNLHLLYGYHYTKAFRKPILSNGLLIRSGQEIRDEFLQQHKSKFSLEELSQITKAWSEYFDKYKKASRDNRIYFNFTLDAFENKQVGWLQDYYGGEQVYFPLTNFPQIIEILSTIGEPLILKLVVEPKNIAKHKRYDFGKVITSSYQQLINPNSYRFDIDAYQTVAIPPRNIEILSVKNNNDV